VVNYPDLNERERLFERCRDEFVGTSPEKIDAFNDPMPFVEQDQPEDLLVQVIQARR